MAKPKNNPRQNSSSDADETIRVQSVESIRKYLTEQGWSKSAIADYLEKELELRAVK